MNEVLSCISRSGEGSSSVLGEIPLPLGVYVLAETSQHHI
ncbi:hypothetical protein SDC9_159329 [bioreactor metagenome]|uniref:Uncharacterized protein n=1 Tax=bioreactor metagenome TaxID=1076179 RepID=A0A645FF96_9ZZZZ